MKKLTILLSVLFAASFAYAEGAKTEVKDKAKDAKAEAKAEVKDAKAALTHEVEAEVVSIDSTKGTITLKTEKGESTAPVEGKAKTSLKDVKAGQKVTVVCRDNEKGEHQAVSEIKTKPSTKPAM
jgi:hypothetical protein